MNDCEYEILSWRENAIWSDVTHRPKMKGMVEDEGGRRFESLSFGARSTNQLVLIRALVKNQFVITPNPILHTRVDRIKHLNIDHNFTR